MLAGLIAEIDQLLQHQQDPRLKDSIDDIASNLVWRATGSDVFELQTQMWQAKLAAAGWAVPLPAELSPIREAENPPDVKPLPGHLLAEAEETITRDLARENPIWAAATIITLWAHAAAAARSGPAEARRIAAVLTKQVREHDARHRAVPFPPAPGEDQAPGVRALHPQVRRLAAAAAAWCEAADPTVPCVLQPARKAGNVRAVARQLLAQPGFKDWTYRGLRADDDSLVVVEEPDGSRRLLRDAEACARGRFAWGYNGTGPHALAETLLPDILDDYAHCPSCLRGSPCGAGSSPAHTAATAASTTEQDGRQPPWLRRSSRAFPRRRNGSEHGAPCLPRSPARRLCGPSSATSGTEGSAEPWLRGTS